MKKLIFWILGITIFRIIILFLSPLELSFDEAQYWHWSRDLSFGYFSKPPVIAYLIRLTTSICGNGESCIRLGAPLAHGLTTVFVYLAAKNLFDKKTAFFSGLTYLTLTGVSFSSNFISTDAPLLLFFAVSLYLCIKALMENHIKWWFLLGFSIGFGLLSKYSMIIFPITIFAYMLLNYKSFKLKHYSNLLLSTITALLVYSPNFFWNYLNHFASYAHTKSNGNLSNGISFHPLKSLEFLGGQFLVFGIILFACFLFFIFRPIKNAKTLNNSQSIPNSFSFLFLLSAPLIGIMTILGLISRANANWAAPSYIAATILVSALLINKGNLKLLKMSLCLNITLMLVISSLLSFNLIKGKHKLSGWKQAGLEISEIVNSPETKLLFDERKILTPFLYYLKPQDFKRLIKWNPRQEINDHYDLTTNIQDHIGKDFVYISRWQNADALKAYFNNSKELDQVTVSHGKKKKTTLYLTKLNGFKGF